MKHMWSCMILLLLTLYDPQNILPKAAEALNESMQYLTLYQNSVTLGTEHHKLLDIIKKLEKLERQLTVIAPLSI